MRLGQVASVPLLEQGPWNAGTCFSLYRDAFSSKGVWKGDGEEEVTGVKEGNQSL